MLPAGMETKLASVGIVADKQAARRKVDSIVAKWDESIKFEDGINKKEVR
jgi:hypothetical protein